MLFPIISTTVMLAVPNYFNYCDAVPNYFNSCDAVPKHHWAMLHHLKQQDKHTNLYMGRTTVWHFNMNAENETVQTEVIN